MRFSDLKALSLSGAARARSSRAAAVLANIVDHHYKGTIYVVNPGGPVMGLPTFPSINDVPDRPELGYYSDPCQIRGPGA